MATRPFDAILFDLGSTLIYFDGEFPEVIQQSDALLLANLEQAGLEVDRPAFLETFRRRLNLYYAERDTEFIEHTTAYILREVLAEFGYPDLPDELIRPALAAMYAASQAHWQVEPDALPTLSALRQEGYRMGLISNASDDEDVQTLVDKARLRPFFEVILTSAAEGIRKPNPRIFQTALHRLQIAPHQAVMVGDTLGADILGAKLAGMKAVWVTRHANTAANNSHEDTIQPDAIVSGLSVLPEALRLLD